MINLIVVLTTRLPNVNISQQYDNINNDKIHSLYNNVKNQNIIQKLWLASVEGLSEGPLILR